MPQPDRISQRAAYSMNEAAHLLSVSRSYLYQLEASGQLHTVRLGHRRLVTATEIERLLEEGAEPARARGNSDEA